MADINNSHAGGRLLRKSCTSRRAPRGADDADFRLQNPVICI
jgi:hypothetical protein